VEGNAFVIRTFEQDGSHIVVEWEGKMFCTPVMVVSGREESLSLQTGKQQTSDG
jgi:hypothetical protein